MNTAWLYFPDQKTRRLIQINDSNRMFHRVYEVSWTLFCFMVLFISWTRFKITTIQNVKKTFQNIVNSKYNAYLCSWCRNWNSWADIHSLVSTSGGGHTRSLDCCHTLDLFIFSAESSFKLYPLHLSPALPNFACLLPRHFQKAEQKIYLLSKCLLALAETKIFDTTCTELQLLHQFNSLDVIVNYFIRIVLREQPKHSPHSPGDCGQEAASWCLWALCVRWR